MCNPWQSFIKNFFRVFDPVCVTMIFISWIAVILLFKLTVIVGRRLGLTVSEEEIPFYPFRLDQHIV